MFLLIQRLYDSSRQDRFLGFLWQFSNLSSYLSLNLKISLLLSRNEASLHFRYYLFSFDLEPWEQWVESVPPVIIFCFSSTRSPSKLPMAEAVYIKLCFYLHMCAYIWTHLAGKRRCQKSWPILQLMAQFLLVPSASTFYCSRVHQVISQKDPW